VCCTIVGWFVVSCACHDCLLGALATAGKAKFMSTHKDICQGKCNDPSCMHKSHKRARAKKAKIDKDDEKAALLAGMYWVYVLMMLQLCLHDVGLLPHVSS
jgi:predicted metal-binding membrane protein